MGKSKGKHYLNENVCLNHLEAFGIRTNGNLRHDIKIVCKKYKKVDDVVDWCKKYWKGYDKDVHLQLITKLVKQCNDNEHKDKDLYIAPNITITRNELATIKSLESIEQQKLITMLLILAKIEGKDKQGRYCVYENSYDYKKFAGLDHRGRKLNTNNKGKYESAIGKIIFALHDKGLIYQDYTRNYITKQMNILRFEVKFVDENIEDKAFTLCNNDYLYPEHIYHKYVSNEKVKYIQCIKCKREVEKTSNNMKYCNICSKEIRREKENKRIQDMRKKCTHLEKAQ